MVKRALLACFLLAALLVPAHGASETEVKTQVLASYGENQTIDGSYDTSLAADCSNGIFVGREDGDVIAFKGIPYAEAPVGPLRWKDPVPAADSKTVVQAYYYGPSPIQTEWPSEVGSYYPQSEDCLTLNVWSNKAGPSAGKPVMVFIHGGSYGWGGVSDPMYDGKNLVEKYPDLLLVTVEYRLGLLGFIDFSSVPGGEAYATSGNLGLLDQVCALQWVRKNIAAFGGDPANVTVFGESAGAGSVSLLPLMKQADGLFQKVIAESGSVALTYSREECQNLTKLLLKKSGCQTMDELTALSEEEIVALNEELNDYNNFPERDGIVLPEDLYAAYEDGTAAKVDMILGTNADEVRYWVTEMGYYVPGIPGMPIYRHLFPVMYENNCKRLNEKEKANVDAFLSMQSDKTIWNLTELYNELLFRVPAMEQARLHAANGNRVYTYYWTMPGEDEALGACHAIELPYVFCNPQVTIYNGDLYNAALADTVQDLWVNFARTGNPDTAAVHWEVYTADERNTLVLGESIHMESNLKDEQRLLFEPLLHHYFNGCYAQLDLNVPHVWRIAAQVLALPVLAAALIVGIVLFRKKKRSQQAK